MESVGGGAKRLKPIPSNCDAGSIFAGAKTAISWWTP